MSKHIKILILFILFSLSLWGQTCNMDLFWDNYSDVTPGIKVIDERDRNIQGCSTIYNERGMKEMCLAWANQVNTTGDTTINKHITTYVYDENGRLITINSTDDPIMVTIKYGNHEKYVPFDILTGPGKGEIRNIVGARLIKNISEITLTYKDSSVYSHSYIPYKHQLIHKYADPKANETGVKKQQNIEFNELGLPAFISMGNGYIGPISYQDDGWFDSIPIIIKDTIGSCNNESYTVWTYKDGTHLLDCIQIIMSGIKTQNQLFYNEKGLVVGETVTTESFDHPIIHKYYDYEYDSRGNWIKKYNVESTISNSSKTELSVRNIQYY